MQIEESSIATNIDIDCDDINFFQTIGTLSMNDRQLVHHYLPNFRVQKLINY